MLLMSTVKLSTKYQMVIPEETRRRLSLKKGQRLLVLEKNGVIHVVPVKNVRELSGFAPKVSDQEIRDKKDRL